MSKPQGYGKELSQQQLTMLSKGGLTPDLFHPSYIHMHPIADVDSYFSDEEEQSFAEFVDIGKRNPNALGTGRWKLNKKRNKILCLNLSKTAWDISFKSQLTEFISKYIGLDVDCKEFVDCYDLNKKTLVLDGFEYQLRILTSNAKRNGRKKQRMQSPIVDVFSLFDALTYSAISPYISILAIIDCHLGEKDEEESGSDTLSEVMGRACGDRVCCVSSISCNNMRSIIATSVHELLHTIGFDHCNSWRCVMNAQQTEENSIFLSPVNLYKLKYFHNKQHDELFIRQRYENMLNTQLIKHHPDFTSDKEWIIEKLRLMPQIITIN
mmetsp:Transcript_13254/g.13315  ORF Transcript_13254/g.13315 Transcript_13254/m.13315 type:complete len:324 (+) Transcript_13254:173-1144(+)